MPDVKPGNAAMIELGKYFFFDNRLSGDWGVSCATCHDPKKGWGDGQALSAGYPSMEYFRNSPTVLNAKYQKRFLWDGRLDGSDAGTLVRDMITETHTMNMDSRLMQERLKQVPEYHALWEKWRNDDINGMRVFNVIGEFIQSHGNDQCARSTSSRRATIGADRRAEGWLRPVQGQGQLRGLPQRPDRLGRQPAQDRRARTPGRAEEPAAHHHHAAPLRDQRACRTT